MNKFIIGLILILSPIFLFGHNPLSAKYYLEAGEKVSLLNINLSQKGVEQALIKQHGIDVLNTIDQNRYKELIVNYIKDNFNFSVNNEVIKLEEGGIKLGSHQTDLKFVLPPLSKKIEEFKVQIPAFKENDNHQTIFSYKVFGKSDKVILSSNNNYQSTIKLNEQPDSNNGLWTLLGSFSIMISIGLFLLKNK